MTRSFVRPTTDPLTNEPFQVFAPSLRRTIAPEGELIEIDSHLSRRILAGELVREDPAKTKPKSTTTTQAGE